MNKYIRRAGLLFILIWMPAIILIDILIGDLVTGCKTTIKQKLTEHKEHFIALWGNR